MTRPTLGSKITTGIVLGIALGLIATLNIYIAGALVLVGLYLLGRFHTERERTNDFWRKNSHLFESSPEKHRDSEVARANRAAYWHKFPLSGFPHEQHNGRHTDRPFTAQAECEHGHLDFHPMGETFERDGRERIVRRCINYPECTSIWSELA